LTVRDDDTYEEIYPYQHVSVYTPRDGPKNPQSAFDWGGEDVILHLWVHEFFLT
jgi:hypothetical protein